MVRPWFFFGFLPERNREGTRGRNLNKSTFANTHTLGGRTYPVRHYPIAIRLRTRKGCAILCIALNPQSGYFSGAILGVRSVALLHLRKRTFYISEFLGPSLVLISPKGLERLFRPWFILGLLPEGDREGTTGRNLKKCTQIDYPTRSKLLVKSKQSKLNTEYFVMNCYRSSFR